MDNLSLVYVYPVGKDSRDIYEYEFLFSETPEIVWGEDWNIECPAACGDLLPEESTYSEVRHLKTDMKLICAQENSCFSLQDVIDGVLALCWQDINELDEYPDHRFIVPFGEKYNDVVDQLNILDLDFEEDKPGYVPPESKDGEEEHDDNILEIDDTNGNDDDDIYPLDLNF